MRPFGYPVTILNTLDPLGKFDGKADAGFLVRYSNTDGDATFEVKEPEFEGRKPEFEVHVSLSSSAKTKKHDDKTKREAKGKSPVELSMGYRNLSAEFEDFFDNSINEVNAASTSVPTVGKISTNSTNTFSGAGPYNTVVSPTLGESSYVDSSQYPDDSNMPALEDITYSDDEEDVGAEADFTNLETTITVSPIPTTKVHKDHHVTQIIGDLSTVTQTRSMTRIVMDQGGLTQINNEDFHTSMFACFLSQEKPKRVWVLVDLSNGKRVIRTKWAFRNKKDERGIVVRNKYQLVTQGHTQEDGIDYEEVFSPVARIEAIRLFLAYASFMGFMVYQPLGFKDPDYPDKVYKVVKALYGLHQAPRAWYETLANYLLENVKQKPDRIFIIQDKYVAGILRKFGLTDGKSASTPIDTEKPLLKNLDVCACARFQVTPKASHLHAVKRIFRYLKEKPHLGLWYPKDSPFNLVAYSDSDYAGASLDMKSTTGGCQFLGCILISWQCKKQTVVATSSTKAEYVAAASCCAQVNDVVRLQALIDRKKVIITEAKIREALRLDDAKGINCLPNEEIFIELSRMGYEKPSKKLTFYKAFFSAQWKAQVCDLSSDTTKYSSLALTQKVFANMRMVGKGFSRVETPLFKGMLVPHQAAANVDDVVAADDDDDDVPAVDAEPTLPSPPPTTTPPPPAQELPSTSQVEVREEEEVKSVWFEKIAKDAVMDDQEDASKQGEIIANINADEDVTLKDVVAFAKEIKVEKTAEIKKDADV
nr:hypothetical protein [Tanacetum cinerariifolium]